MLIKISALYNRVVDFMAYLSCVLVALIFFVNSADVILRYLAGITLPWSVEFSEYSLVVVTFMAAAWVLKKEAHVFIDTGLNALTPKKRVMVNIFTSLLGAVICALVLWAGASNVWFHILQGTRMTEKSLQLPTAPLLAIVPAGFLLFSIQFIIRAYGFLKRWKAPPAKETKQFEDLGEI